METLSHIHYYKLAYIFTVYIYLFLSPYNKIDLDIFLYKGGLSSLKECGEKGEGEDGLARDWYMVGRAGVAGNEESIALHNIQEKQKCKVFKRLV